MEVIETTLEEWATVKEFVAKYTNEPPPISDVNVNLCRTFIRERCWKMTKLNPLYKSNDWAEMVQKYTRVK